MAKHDGSTHQCDDGTECSVAEGLLAGDSRTDRQKFTALMSEFGVEFVLDTGGDVIDIVRMTEGGYSGFYTEFEFDKDGKFVSQGAWE